METSANYVLEGNLDCFWEEYLFKQQNTNNYLPLLGIDHQDSEYFYCDNSIWEHYVLPQPRQID